jgi:excisionase family DNA binding protein
MLGGRIVTRRKYPQYVSVRQLADELEMTPQLLHYYLKCVGVKTMYVGDPTNATRFIPEDQVVDTVNAIRAYRKRRPVPGLTVTEAAARLKLSVNTIRVLVAQQKLRPRRVRRRLSFSENELERYRQKRRRRVA